MNSIVGSEELGRRIRNLRAERHLTLKQVEHACGLSATHLSEIERGRTSPTIGALTRIARALGRPASYFIEPDELPDVAVVPRERLGSFRAAGGARVEPLSSGVPGCRLFVYRLGLGTAARGAFTLEAQEPPAEALYLVRRGRVEARFGGTRLDLRTGDAAQGRIACEHELHALGEDPAEVIAVLDRRLEEAP